MSHVDADFAGLASPLQTLASPTAVPPGAAVPEDKREQFNDLLTQLQDNQAAKTMARTLTDSTSTGSSLQLAFLDAQAAYHALQSTWSSQADTPGLRAAYARMETCRAAIRQWVQDYIPSRLQTAFFEFLELTASPLVDHVAGVAESITAQRAPSLTRSQLVNLGPSIARMNQEALGALTREQVGWLTDLQLEALGPKVAELSSESLDSLLITRPESVPPAAIKALFSSPPVRLTDSQLTHLTSRLVSSLTRPDFNRLGVKVEFLNPLLLRALAPEQVSGVSLSALTIEKLGLFSASQLAQVDYAQLTGLAQDKLQALGGDIAGLPLGTVTRLPLQDLSGDQLEALTSEHLHALTPSQVNQLPLGRLSIGQLGSLQDAQLAQATPSTVANLTAAQVQALGVKIAGLPADALAALRPDQVSLMTREQVVALDAKFANLQVSAIHQILNLNATPPMILSVTTAGITALVRDHIETLTADRLVALAETQVRDLTVAQVMSLGPLASRLNAVWLSPLLEGLGPTDLQSLTLDHFSVDQLGRLSVEQTTRLSESQVKALDSIKLIQLVGQGKFSSIPARMFAYIDLTRIDSSQLAAITVNQLAQATPYTVANLTAAQVRALGVKIAGLPAGALAALRPDQVRLMTPEQANALGAKIADLEGSVIDAIPDATLQSLITTLFGGTSQPTLTLQQINSLGKGVAFLPDPYLSGLLRDPASFQVISTEGITALFRRSRPGDEPDPLARYERGSIPNRGFQGPQQWVSFSESHAGKLTPQQVTALLPEDLARLSSGSVAALTTTVLRSLTGAQVSGLRFSSLTSAQLSVLRPDQLAQVPVAEVRGLSREQMIALGPRLAGFSDEALGVLTEAQLNGIPAQQMAALGSKALRLSRSVRRDLLVRFPVFKERNPELFLDDQTLDLFTDQAVQKWSREQTRLCTAAQLLLLGDKLRQIKPAAIVGLKPQALRGVPLTQWAESQLRWMSPQQLEGVTAAEVSSLSDPQLLALGRSIVGLSPSAMSGVRLATLSPVQLRALRAPNMTQLTIEQVNSLSPDQFRLLLGVRGLSDDVLRGLSPLLVNAMTRSQVDALGPRKALLPQAA